MPDSCDGGNASPRAAAERGLPLDAAGALLAAALALPGVVPATASAQAMPDAGVVAFKYLDYRDWQPGADRMRVRSPNLYALVPFADAWVVDGSLLYDGMSGASPLYHDTLSGASGEGVRDYRTAGDVKLTRYFDRFSIGVGGAYSHERDYISRAGSLDVRIWTPDRNRTFAFGIGGAADRIDSEHGAADHRRKNTLDLLVGITEALSPTAIVQSTLTWSNGHGYYSDPYKLLDARPERRRILAWLTRFNRYLPSVDGTLKLGYRFLADSFGGDSHMLEAAWSQALPMGWTVQPSLRYYTQGAADFYRDPPFPSGFRFGQPYSADARLSAFGAWTPGILVAKDLGQGWSVDVRAEFYRQRGAWRLGGDGSPGLAPFSARWISVGLAKTF